MKQQLKEVKTPFALVRIQGYPEKHIQEVLDFETWEEAGNYKKDHPEYRMGNITDDLHVMLVRDYLDQEPTFENKAMLRMEYCRDNKVYTICACCGKELHEHQKETHTKTKWGIIGSECIKKVILAGIELE